MDYVLTASEMRTLDRVTIEEIGLPGAVLMENAGRAVAEATARAVGDLGRPHVAVVCGTGNNGGDGFVAARCLRERGVSAVVYLGGDAATIRGDAATHYRVYEQTGGVVASIADAGALAEHRHEIEEADAVIDAIFGTGLAREVEGHYRDVIEVINRAGGVRVAVDVPSGLSADTGEELGVAVLPDVTVTIAFRKLGLTVAPGFARAGRVEVADIGIPRQLAQAHGVALGLLASGDLEGSLPRHPPTVHKNRRGHVVVVAGSPGKRGAARLTSWGALRSGAGLVTVASPWRGSEPWAPDPVMTAELDPEGPEPSRRLRELAERAQAVAIGPGMPTSKEGRALVLEALSTLEVPLVLDADALNHIGADPGRLADARGPVVLTPHPGEAARLLGTSPRQIEADRVASVRRLAEDTRAVVVLKGARTLVCDGLADDGFVTINPSGGPALATAGSGDVLTGVVAALAGQGVAPGEAARLGVYLHGLAADRVSRDVGGWGVTSSDIADAVPGAVRALAGARLPS